MADRPFFVINPMSAGGETGRLWRTSLGAAVRDRFPAARWASTAGREQAAGLAARATREGADLVVAVGGDGTVNEVVNGLMGESLAPADPALPPSEGASWLPGSEPPERPVLGIVPRGTGCDFIKSLGVPNSLGGALGLLADGRTVTSDLCEMTFAAQGGRARRYSMNMCGCGASGEVARQVNGAGRPQHGFWAFFRAAARAALAYRPETVEIAVDSEPARPTRLLGLFVCKGEYCGGGMRPGRGAALDSGRLRVVEIGDIPLPRILRYGHRLYTGRFDDVPGVRVYDARTLQVTGPEAVLVDCDGEQPGTLPTTYRVVPAALRVIAR